MSSSLTKVSLAACVALLFSCGDDSGPGGGGGAGAGGTGGEGAGPTPCVTLDDCPMVPGQCLLRSCDGGFCGTTPVPAGTPAMTQVLDDCKRIECDGAGSSQEVPEDGDVKDDGEPCTQDSCSMGMRVHAPLPIGTVCDETGTCDATGACVECLGATDCGLATECSAPSCTGGRCGTTFTAAGTAVALQTPGDCLTVVCDGAGATSTANDDADILDDQNPCTLDGCSMGMGTVTPQPGIPCGVSGTCDDQGQCIGCTVPSDCPGMDTFCQQRTCVANVCGFSYTAADTPLPSGQQTSSDCQTLVCGLTGQILPVEEPTDVFVDGLECTLDQCVGGAVMNPPLSIGSPCSSGGTVCDGMGACVGCNTPADCPDPPAYPCSVAACTMGTCGGADAAPGTVCAAPSCAGGVAQLTDVCSGGACVDGGSQACAPYVCGPSACTTSCAGNAGCSGGFVCDTGLGECTSGPTCTDYCAAVMSACTGGNAQYFSQQACLESCSSLPDGLASDTGGNTVGCRTYHAGVAMGAPAAHCPHAGPGGAGVCGADCEGFCAIALGACTGGNQVYASLAACLSECGNFPTSPPYNASVTSGDSFACRMYHLTAASVDPAGHCSHIPEASPTCQ